jgi:chorismate mutase
MNTGVNGSNGQSQAADLHVQEVIRSAERELHELLDRRAELMKRIGTIKQTLAGLANIFGDGVLSDQLLTFLDRKSASRQPRFTRACRVVLMEAKKPLGARLVCQALQHRFPELLERHKDPIASVTTVLNRLADYTEARCSRDATGRRVWEWIAEPENRADLLLGGESRLTPQP